MKDSVYLSLAVFFLLCLHSSDGFFYKFQIRLESKISSSTRLLYCTTGMLLRRLSYDPQLRSTTHVIVDEVHERSIDSDFLLLILADLCKVRTDLTVILMSATLNAELFSQYFGNVPVLSIPGKILCTNTLSNMACYTSNFFLTLIYRLLKVLGETTRSYFN